MTNGAIPDPIPGMPRYLVEWSEMNHITPVHYEAGRERNSCHESIYRDPEMRGTKWLKDQPGMGQCGGFLPIEAESEEAAIAHVRLAAKPWRGKTRIRAKATLLAPAQRM